MFKNILCTWQASKHVKESLLTVHVKMTRKPCGLYTRESKDGKENLLRQTYSGLNMLSTLRKITQVHDLYRLSSVKTPYCSQSNTKHQFKITTHMNSTKQFLKYYYFPYFCFYFYPFYSIFHSFIPTNLWVYFRAGSLLVSPSIHHPFQTIFEIIYVWILASVYLLSHFLLTPKHLRA